MGCNISPKVAARKVRFLYHNFICWFNRIDFDFVPENGILFCVCFEAVKSFVWLCVFREGGAGLCGAVQDTLLSLTTRLGLLI